MATSVSALKLRNVLGRKEWGAPQPFGPDGWQIWRNDMKQNVIVSVAPFDDVEYIHASIAGETMPTYEDLKLLHRAAFDNGYAFQVFAPASDHINIHRQALHLWGRVDGKSDLPEFGNILGSI